MPAKLSTLENALQFRYFGNDRLYTDHEGRRAIVDVEGFGIMRIVTADPPILTVRWGGEPEAFCPEFQNGAIVLANQPGEVWMQVLKGRSTVVNGGSIRAAGNFFGSGWVISASREFVVDDRRELAPAPSEEFPVPFFRSIRGSGSWSIVPDASVKCHLIDSFSIADESALKGRGFRVQNISAITQLDSAFPDGTPWSSTVASHLNAATFTLEIPADNDGLILRKTYDRFHGRQRARVMIDGALAGWWYEPGEDRERRWHVSDFGIPLALTQGKSTIQVTIDPPAGVALWSVSQIDVFALRSIL